MPKSNDEARLQIFLLVGRFQTAWNSHDMRAYADLHCENASWVTWRGQLYRGRQEIYERHVEAHATFFRSSTMQNVVIEAIEFIGSDAAIGHVTSEMIGDERFPGSTRKSRYIFAFSQESGRWRIRTGQNTPIAEANG